MEKKLGAVMNKLLFRMMIVLMSFSFLVACGEAPSSDGPDGADSNPSTNSENSDTSSSATSEKSEEVLVYDEELEHLMVALDTQNRSVVVIDLNRCNGVWSNMTNKNTVVWEKGGFDGGLDGVKFRKSPQHGDVILLTSSGGSAWMVSYPGKEILWSVNGIGNAHSIEMLPNGDIVVAASGSSTINYKDGGLHYFPAGSTTESAFYSLPFAHAALWDPDNECLWSVGFPGVVAVEVFGSGTDAKMAQIEELGCEKKNFSGHDMVPMFGQDGKYMVSDNSSLYVFDSKTGKMSVDYRRTSKEVKGIAYFEDGTLILAPANLGNPTTPALTKVLRVFALLDESEVPVKKEDIPFKNREFYKIHTFTQDYK